MQKRAARVLAVGMFVCILVYVCPAYADFYKWISKDGTVWLTDDPVKLPEKSLGQFERLEVAQESSETAFSPSNPRTEASPDVEAYLEARSRQVAEKRQLEEEIQTLEQELTTAQTALERVYLSDTKGYWFRVDPETGKKVRASYKDSGARWSYDTWPAVPLSTRTTGADERRRIESEIERLQTRLESAKRELVHARRSI